MHHPADRTSRAVVFFLTVQRLHDSRHEDFPKKDVTNTSEDAMITVILQGEVSPAAWPSNR